MNTREQLLQRGIEKLNADKAHLSIQVDTMIDLLELQGSIACGFAWDFATYCLEGMSYTDLVERTHEFALHTAILRWEESRKQAHEMMKASVQ